jgi:hypothetical protein
VPYLQNPWLSTVSLTTIGLQAIPGGQGAVVQKPAGNASQTALASFSMVLLIERLLPK